MKSPLVLALLASSTVPALHANNLEGSMTHQGYAAALLDLLAETELSLAQCKDTASRDAQIPRLRTLSQEMANLHQIKQNLPEPTIADYIAAESQVGEFNMLWSAIKKHVQRLDEEELYNEELLNILKLVN